MMNVWNAKSQRMILYPDGTNEESSTPSVLIRPIRRIRVPLLKCEHTDGTDGG